MSEQVTLSGEAASPLSEAEAKGSLRVVGTVELDSPPSGTGESSQDHREQRRGCCLGSSARCRDRVQEIARQEWVILGEFAARENPAP